MTNAVRLPARHALPLEDKEQEEYKDKRKDGVRFLARGYTHARAITPSQGTSGLSEMTDSDWLWTPSQASLPSHCRIDPGGCASAAGTSEIRPGALHARLLGRLPLRKGVSLRRCASPNEFGPLSHLVLSRGAQLSVSAPGGM